jgi:polyhydroxyalkanoate synthesis repressor PhaR
MPLIKRYANRKLYDTQAGQYVTLEELAEFIRRGEDITVRDHATGRDLTSLTLMQVLFH